MKRSDFWRGVAVGGGVFAAGLLIGGAAQSSKPTDVTKFETVAAKEFRVVDDHDRVMAVFTQTDHGGAATIFDARGRPMIAFGLGSGGGLTQMLDRGGEIRAEINASGEVQVYSPEGQLRARLASYKEDGNTRQPWAGQVTAFDRNGAIVGRVPRDGFIDH
ncbi:hypothetical protein [Pyruvatibacter sp.]|uniref:hypothetical protein n=1 Tax=Pyruvatibacter sp. TaxID=1981328 RepID=UPI0032F003E7